VAADRVSNTQGVGWNTAVGGGHDTNALAFTVPSGKASGVIAVVATYAFTGNNGTPAFATPSGWTAIPGATGTVTVGTDVGNHQMFWRRLDGTETTVNFTPDRACWKQGWIMLSNGALASGDPTEAAGFTATATSGTTKSHTVGSASADGSLAVFSGGNFNNTLVATISNSFVEYFESNNQYCATKAVNTGPVGATTMTLSSGSDAGFAAAVIIKPAAAGGGDVTATGAVTQAAAVAAGAATETIAGAGATTQAAATPTAAGTETVAGAGAVTQPAASLAGAALEAIAGAAAIGQAAAALAGTAVEEIAGAGAMAQAAGAPAGAATETFAVDGAVAQGAPSIVAIGSVGSDVVGVAAVTQAAGSLAGVLALNFDVTGVGATTQAAAALAGAGLEILAGAGAVTQPVVTVAGVLEFFAGGASGGEAATRGPTRVLVASVRRRATVASGRRVARITSQGG